MRLFSSVHPALAAVSLVALCTTATAAPQLQRVRGTIESATDTSVTVKTSDGTSQTIKLAPDTHFASVVKSSLSDMGDGKFIGTATKGENPPTALEVVIFPDAMKGTAEGHYDWDPILDTTASAKVPVKSSMTNGTVKAATAPGTNSAMTNGTVKSDKAMGMTKTVTVTYDNGKSLDIVVPPSAPIVAFEVADPSILKTGAKLFSVAAVEGGTLNGKLVAVGKDGVTPPM